jgi:predicted phage terminase large subunit-like protein
LKRRRATKDTDFAVIQAWGVEGEDRYLLGRFRAKVNLAASVHAIEGMLAQWPGVRRALIELKANGPSAVGQLQAKWGNLIEGVPVQGESKEQRAEACTPVVEGGHVYIPDATIPGFKWADDEFLPEVTGFPHRRRDDHVDAMTMALIWLVKNRPRTAWIGRLKPKETR